jgi:WD40 repeat protein
MSGPDGEEVTPDGKTLFTAIGNAGVAVFDLTTTPPTVIATVPTGTSADYDGPLGIAPCVASWNGEAGSAATCGDDRADEMAYDPVHQVLAVINGDPGLPFVTFIDMSGVVARTSHCLPVVPTLAYGPYEAGFTMADYTSGAYPFQGSGTAIPQPSPILDPQAGGSFNPPNWTGLL